MRLTKFASFRLFLSTLSLRRATHRRIRYLPHWTDFYPRSPCGERLQCHPPQPRPPFISIHALLAESDRSNAQSANTAAKISIHALLAESDNLRYCMPTGPRYFYPRSPCGERRFTRHPIPIFTIYFYPRSPCGERLTTATHTTDAPKFLSTLSLRRATYDRNPHHGRTQISIHALLAESDVTGSESQKLILHFYPRSPCGERPATRRAPTPQPRFLSTLSLRRATGILGRRLWHR